MNNNKSEVIVQIELDEQKLPQDIKWRATGSTADQWNTAKSTMMAFWDGKDKTALRLDIWTKDMMVDEMTDFFFQVLMSMGDTFDKATHQQKQVEEIKTFAKQFLQSCKEEQLKK